MTTSRHNRLKLRAGQAEERESIGPESEVAVILGIVSFERTPLLEISIKAAAIEALGWQEYDRLPQRWIVKYEKVAPLADGSSVAELATVLGDYWVAAAEIPPSDLLTAEEVDPTNEAHLRTALRTT